MYLDYFLYFQWDKLPFSWLLHNSEDLGKWTDHEQWSTVCEAWLDITCWIGAHWSWLGKIHPWYHPLPFPSQGTTDNFRYVQAICLSHPWMQLCPGHQEKLCDTQNSNSYVFWGPSVRDSFEACLWQLSRALGICGCHHFACPTWWGTSPAMGQPPVESRSCFYCLSSYTIYSSTLLLCINFLSCPSCHICTVTSWFPIFNCPQRASSRATPALVRALICHCPNWSSKHLKFSFYERVVFLQVRD